MKPDLNSRPQLGVMLHITPQADQSPQSTYNAFTNLVQEAEQLGFDHAWVTEHHFTPHSLTPAPLMMMGHFLANTQKIKLGSAAVLVGYHNPIEIAEQIATLNTLHPERVLCGFAKGGPFESQKAAFKADSELSRARMEEAVPALIDLINHPSHQHHGEHYQWDAMSLHPQTEMPAENFYMATSHDSTIRLAAENGLGLMAAQFWDQDKIADNVEAYRKSHPQGQAPQMMAARGLFIDEDENRARELALAHIQSFRAQKAQLWGNHRGPMQKLQPEQLLDRMLCGTQEQVQQQLRSLLKSGVTRLGLNPLTGDHACRLEQLKTFKENVWHPVLNTSLESVA